MAAIPVVGPAVGSPKKRVPGRPLKPTTTAEAAGRVISVNTQLVSKPVIAHHEDKAGFIQVYNGGYDFNRSLAEQVQILVQVKLPGPGCCAGALVCSNNQPGG
jgi:hypothetical protein